jgi:hypothetical protein
VVCSAVWLSRRFGPGETAHQKQLLEPWISKQRTTANIILPLCLLLTMLSALTVLSPGRTSTTRTHSRRATALVWYLSAANWFSLVDRTRRFSSTMSGRRGYSNHGRSGTMRCFLRVCRSGAQRIETWRRLGDLSLCARIEACFLADCLLWILENGETANGADPCR